MTDLFLLCSLNIKDWVWPEAGAKGLEGGKNIVLDRERVREKLALFALFTYYCTFFVWQTTVVPPPPAMGEKLIINEQTNKQTLLPQDMQVHYLGLSPRKFYSFELTDCSKTEELMEFSALPPNSTSKGSLRKLV